MVLGFSEYPLSDHITILCRCQASVLGYKVNTAKVKKLKGNFFLKEVAKQPNPMGYIRLKLHGKQESLYVNFSLMTSSPLIFHS